MNNLNLISESGMTRRYWKQFCKDNKCAENSVINAKNAAFGIAFRQLKNWGDSWMFAYECFRTKNLSEKGKEKLPKLP